MRRCCSEGVALGFMERHTVKAPDGPPPRADVLERDQGGDTLNQLSDLWQLYSLSSGPGRRAGSARVGNAERRPTKRAIVDGRLCVACVE